MFKKSIALIGSFFMLSMSTSVLAEDYKIGAVNMAKVMQESPQYAAADKKIQDEFAPRDRSLVAKQKKLKDMEDRLAKDGAIMSESERRKLERDIISEKRDIRRTQDEFRDDLTIRTNEERNKILKQTVEAINGIAKSKGYDLILSDGIIYAADKVDITTLILDELKKKHSGN